MDKPTEATAPTAIKTHTAQRAAYRRASALAGRIVDRLTVLPHDVEARGEGSAYGLRLHFGAGLSAGRGVLEVARIADCEATRDQAEHTDAAWIECRAAVEGVPLVARALLTAEDADQLLQQTPAATPTITPRVPAVTPAAPPAQPVTDVRVITLVKPLGAAQ